MSRFKGCYDVSVVYDDVTQSAPEVLRRFQEFHGSTFVKLSQLHVIEMIQFLYGSFFVFVLAGVQEKMGVMNRGVVYALWDYEPQSDDELGFIEGDCMTVLRREDEVETEWWWARCGDREGYIPRNLLGVSLSSN